MVLVGASPVAGDEGEEGMEDMEAGDTSTPGSRSRFARGCV